MSKNVPHTFDQLLIDLKAVMDHPRTDNFITDGIFFTSDVMHTQFIDTEYKDMVTRLDSNLAYQLTRSDGNPDIAAGRRLKDAGYPTQVRMVAGRTRQAVVTKKAVVVYG